MENKNEIRIQKYIADCGVCSRRNAEKLVTDNRVTINGRRAVIGDKVSIGKQRVKVDGVLVNYKTAKKYQYFALYKPRGYISTMSDEAGRKCISDLITTIKGRVYLVGRLDKESEGLVLLTDDGELANKVTHPKHHIPKTYRVTISGEPDPKKLDVLRQGVELDDGYKTIECDVSIRSVHDERTVIEITIYEGKNRQIRRMCEAVGLDVLLLKRERIGDVRIGNMSIGQFRKLNDDEIEYLQSLK